MTRTKILNAPMSKLGWFGSITKNTGISQRETLEEIIVNLSSAIGIKVIYKQENSRGSYFYEIQASGFKGYQSASNTILELSRRLLSTQNDQ